MPRHTDEEFQASITASRVKGEANRQKFMGGYLRDTARWRLEPSEMDLLARITSRPISGRALLSNVHVRAAAQNALVEASAEAYREYPDRQWLWITICWDAGVTWEREPHIDYVSLRSIAYRHLQRSGLEGFGMVETDVWKNITGEPGRRMVAHVHFLGYPADGQHVKVTELEAEMCKRTGLTNSLEKARSVDITNVGKTPGDFARIGQYMSKTPSFAKNPIPQDCDDHRLRDVEHAAGSCVRLVEVFSHCEIGDVMFSIGKGAGKDIATAVRQAVKHEVRERPGVKPAPSSREVDQLWKGIRQNNGSKNFRPCRIITRRDQRE